jgi:hypothetical protein
MAESENKRHIRRTLAEFAERKSDVLEKFFEDAMSADRTVSVQCPNCRHRHQVDVPDWRARGQAVAELLNQGYGRPGTEAGETGGGLTVIRKLVLPDGSELEGGAAGAGPVLDSELVLSSTSRSPSRPTEDKQRAPPTARVPARSRPGFRRRPGVCWPMRTRHGTVCCFAGGR